VAHLAKSYKVAALADAEVFAGLVWDALPELIDPVVTLQDHLSTLAVGLHARAAG
jgi:hypothetical protein